MSIKATAKTIRISPRKMNLVAGLVRGRSVNDALVILEHTPKRAAAPLAKVIKSAAANAENNNQKNINDLAIEHIHVNAGVIIKRARAAARGRMHPIRHRTCHVTVEVNEVKSEAGNTSSKQATKKAEKKVKQGVK
ncbi:MAG: 50S ribosomal protein L22 [Candidatus Saccharimonadales bacterium]